MAERGELESVFLDHLEWIERACSALSRRHGLGPDEADDFASWAKLKLMEGDYALLAKFRGESRLTTYLTVVLARLFRDFRVRERGRWRASAAARRMGPVAARLETLVRRDGFSVSEAGELLRTNGATEMNDAELGRLLAELPTRTPLRPVESGGVPEHAVSTEAADGPIIKAEEDAQTRAGEQALSQALAELEVEDRVILKMHYWEAMSVADISRGLGLPQKPLYRRLSRLMKVLRQSLESRGYGADDAHTLLNR